MESDALKLSDVYKTHFVFKMGSGSKDCDDSQTWYKPQFLMVTH